MRRGIRCGFIVDSDDHCGAGGDSHRATRERYLSAHSGPVGANARGLAREVLREVFFARRAYTTNGPCIVVDFRVNGVPMGRQVRVQPGESVRVHFRTWLDGMMDRVELVPGTETTRRP